MTTPRPCCHFGPTNDVSDPGTRAPQGHCKLASRLSGLRRAEVEETIADATSLSPSGGVCPFARGGSPRCPFYDCPDA
jgi:hypothetical protein